VGTRNPVAGSDNIQKCRVLTYLAYRQFWDPLLISATVKVSDFKFSTQLWFDELSSMPKTTFRLKLMWVWAREHPQAHTHFVSYSHNPSCIPNLKSLPSAVVEISRRSQKVSQPRPLPILVQKLFWYATLRTYVV